MATISSYLLKCRHQSESDLLLQFRLDYALSREQQNKKGGKMYIQDKVLSPFQYSSAELALACCNSSHKRRLLMHALLLTIPALRLDYLKAGVVQSILLPLLPFCYPAGKRQKIKILLLFR